MIFLSPMINGLYWFLIYLAIQWGFLLFCVWHWALCVLHKMLRILASNTSSTVNSDLRFSILILNMFTSVLIVQSDLHNYSSCMDLNIISSTFSKMHFVFKTWFDFLCMSHPCIAWFYLTFCFSPALHLGQWCILPEVLVDWDSSFQDVVSAIEHIGCMFCFPLYIMALSIHI